MNHVLGRQSADGLSLEAQVDLRPGAAREIDDGSGQRFIQRGVCPTEALKFHDLGDATDPVTQTAKRRDAKAWKQEEETSPSVLYVRHEAWMEDKANAGVQISPADEDIIYEQNNFDHLRGK